MEIDRQAIERRDFPIARRGYDPAAVDAHLRAVASEVEERERKYDAGAQSPLATVASSQVQSILQAAEAAAADIERDAQQRAEQVRGEADRDARRTREDAIAKAREHAASVAQATNVLLERVASLDGEASALLGRLREGAERLARDLSALDANMGALYDASSGNTGAASPGPPQRVAAPDVSAAPPAGDEPITGAAPAPSPARSEPAVAPPGAEPGAEEVPAREGGGAPRGPAQREDQGENGGDVDGARLVALNMALSGEPRAATARYLAEHFALGEQDKLVDEVYAAIEA
jgi:DivIVA domain-containing protein